MIFNVIFLVIGALVLGLGLYYLGKEKSDKDSRKIYGIISGIGAAVVIGFIIKMLVEFL